MSHNDFDKRMKQYEGIYNQKIIPHIPIIIRIDGHNFHSYTKKRKCNKIFDEGLIIAFQYATRKIYSDMGNFEIAYGQSDEISILIYNPDTMTQEYFDGKIFKLCSVVASLFTGYFNDTYIQETGPIASFDCRVFQLPINEVTNYFIWRQKDATRNSIQMLGRSEFSHKQLNNKSCLDIQDMLMVEKGINWNDIRTSNKRGWCFSKDGLDEEIPILTQYREYIERFLKKEII